MHEQGRCPPVSHEHRGARDWACLGQFVTRAGSTAAGHCPGSAEKPPLSDFPQSMRCTCGAPPPMKIRALGSRFPRQCEASRACGAVWQESSEGIRGAVWSARGECTRGMRAGWRLSPSALRASLRSRRPMRALTCAEPPSRPVRGAQLHGSAIAPQLSSQLVHAQVYTPLNCLSAPGNFASHASKHAGCASF
jgi:hypothetical protein